MPENQTHISCPKCGWEPDETCRWMCSDCKTVWNTFETQAQCPGCGRVYEKTICLKKRGGCGELSPHADWYQEVEAPEKRSGLASIFSWGKNDELSITPNDRRWVERSLLFLTELIKPDIFKSLTTILPSRAYFDRDFTQTEEDADFVLERLIDIMQIKGWDGTIKFFSNRPTEFSDGILATPSAEVDKSWDSPTGQFVNDDTGGKEIWIEIGMLENPETLIAIVARQLAHYKWIVENEIGERDERRADLTCVAFGLGIFMGNAYIQYSQWISAGYGGWQIRRTGYLSEPLIAYAMAWLAHYREEEISWTQYLNKTVRKYFDQSYKYITQNKDSIKWE